MRRRLGLYLVVFLCALLLTALWLASRPPEEPIPALARRGGPPAQARGKRPDEKVPREAGQRAATAAPPGQGKDVRAGQADQAWERPLRVASHPGLRSLPRWPSDAPSARWHQLALVITAENTGEPVAARVNVSYWVDYRSRDSSMYYYFPAGPDGKVWIPFPVGCGADLIIQHPQYVVTGLQKVLAADEELRVALEPAVTLHGVIRNERDMPVEGATVIPAHAGDEAKSDAAGRFECKRVTGRKQVELRVIADGYEHWDRLVHAHDSPIMVKLQPRLRRQGRAELQFETQPPFDYYHVRLGRLVEGRWTRVEPYSLNEQIKPGEYRIHLEAGHYRALLLGHASPKGRPMHEYALEEFDLRQDDDLRVPLRIRAGGALRACVLDRSTRKPLPGWTVLVESQQDYPDIGRIILDWTDGQGLAVLRGAPPGVYQVAYYGPGQWGPRPSEPLRKFEVAVLREGQVTELVLEGRR